jgi:tripeptide aminopeptidase
VHVRGESRSHDAKFFKEITKAYKTAFEKAAKRVKNSEGKSGRVKFDKGLAHGRLRHYSSWWQ